MAVPSTPVAGGTPVAVSLSVARSRPLPSSLRSHGAVEPALSTATSSLTSTVAGFKGELDVLTSTNAQLAKEKPAATKVSGTSKRHPRARSGSQTPSVMTPIPQVSQQILVGAAPSSSVATGSPSQSTRPEPAAPRSSSQILALTTTRPSMSPTPGPQPLSTAGSATSTAPHSLVAGPPLLPDSASAQSSPFGGSTNPALLGNNPAGNVNSRHPDTTHVSARPSQQALQTQLQPTLASLATILHTSVGGSVANSNAAAVHNVPTQLVGSAPPSTPASQGVLALPAQQIMAVLSPIVSRPDGTHRISLELHPAEMGSIQATITVNAGHVTVELHADNAATRQAIGSALPDLRQQLGSGGQQANVFFGGDTLRRQANNSSHLSSPSDRSAGVHATQILTRTAKSTSSVDLRL